MEDLAYPLDQLNREFENQTPNEILLWAWDAFGPDIAATSSFQTQSVPLLHQISQAIPQLPILFLDTGFHFPETLNFRDQLTQKLVLNLKIIKPALTIEAFLSKYGPLYENNPDLCCYLNKIKPLRLELESLKAWISGIRRDQTKTRKDANKLEHRSNGLYKINPLTTWTQIDITNYIQEHKLPQHPLLAQGYPSIGCAPCTDPVSGSEPTRSGRWKNREDQECGMHTEFF